LQLRHSLIVAGLAVALPISAARAATVSIDGPSADIVTAQAVDVDMAPDGTGGVAYLKKVGGINHVFVSRFVGGAFQPPEQVDTGLADPSRRVFISAANGGRLAVTFLNAPDANPTGNLDIVFRPSGGQAWTTPVIPYGANAYYGSVDLAPSGNGYLAYVAKGMTTNVVGAQRITGTDVSLLSGVLNKDIADTVEDDTFQRPVRIGTLNDGSGAVVAFTEQDATMNYHVAVGRVTGSTVGTSQFAEIPTLGTANAAFSANDMADVDVDGTGRAWVAFRENFTYGMTDHGRAIVRPLVGDSLGAAQVIDALPTPPPEAAEFPRLDVNGAGQGLSANARQLQFGVDSAFLSNGTWSGLALSPDDNGAGAAPVPALAESGVGLVAWKPGGATGKTVVARIRGASGFGAQTTLSNPAFGAESSNGLGASADSGSRALVAFIQGAAASARIVAAVVDLPQASGPSAPATVALKNVAPTLSKLKVSKRIRKGTAVAKLTTRRRGHSISFSLSEDATVTLSFERALSGRRVRGRCVKPTSRNRRARTCTRYSPVRTKIRVKAKKGTNRLVFQGRLSRRQSLSPGTYRVTVVARDGQGATSTRKRAGFRLLRARRAA
jgi:hypothetical protein